MNTKTFSYVTFVLLLPALFLGLTAAVVYTQTAKELREEIDTYRHVSPDKRDYALIALKTQELCDKYPESNQSTQLLASITMWYRQGLLSNEQYAPIKKRINQRKKSYDRGKVIAQKLENLYNDFQTSGRPPQKIIEACNDIIDDSNAMQSLRCFAHLMLAKVYFQTKEFDLFQKSAEYLLTESQTPDGLDFPGGKSLIDEIKSLEIKKEIEEIGIDAVLQSWNQELADAESLENILRRYTVIKNLLDTTLAKTPYEQDLAKYDLISSQQIEFLEAFVQKFADNTDDVVLDARIDLGWAIMNHELHRPLSPEDFEMTPKRDNEIDIIVKNDAEKAESIFLKVCELGKGTYYEKNALRALQEVERRKNPKMTPVEEDYVAPPITISNSFSYRFWSTFIFSVLLLLFFFRDSMRHFCLSIFSKFKKK